MREEERRAGKGKRGEGKRREEKKEEEKREGVRTKTLDNFQVTYFTNNF